MSETTISSVTNTESRRVSEWRRFRKAMFSRWVVVIGVVFIVGLIIIAIFANMIAPYNPETNNLSVALQQPSSAHLLGTDGLGRDLLSRVIFGSRVSLLVGIVAVAIAGTVGMSLGLAAGYFGGWTNIIIMRLTDTLMSIPPIVLMLAFSTVLGGGLLAVLLSIPIVITPTYIRLMCGQVLTLKQSDYVTASTVIGASNFRVMFRHLFPNAFPPLLVLITINLGTAIMFEATLSFLGLGIRPPTPAWGSMVMYGYKYLLNYPLLSFAPGVAILLVVLGFNMVGDGLRDSLDPRLRGTL